MLIKTRSTPFSPPDVLKNCFKRAFGFHGPMLPSHPLRSVAVSGNVGSLFSTIRNYSQSMDREDTAWFLPAIRQSYARLAAWMTRGNRLPEPSRLPAPARVETPPRIPDKPRRSAPSRP